MTTHGFTLVFSDHSFVFYVLCRLTSVCISGIPTSTPRPLMSTVSQNRGALATTMQQAPSWWRAMSHV